jgi:hypothetical protein
MNKAFIKSLFLLLLISTTIYTGNCEKELAYMKEKETHELKLKIEADEQAYKMEQLKIISAVSLAVVAALLKIYTSYND